MGAFRLSTIPMLFCLLIGCGAPPSGPMVLFDFESDADLDRIHWKCFTLYSLSNRHASHGKGSLKVSLYPSQWPGWHPVVEQRNWLPYQTLRFEIFNPAAAPLVLTLRIDDRKDHPPFGDRFNRKLVLTPGANAVSIPLASLTTSGTARNLDLGRIHRMLLFRSHPKEKSVFYLDHVRLETVNTEGQ